LRTLGILSLPVLASALLCGCASTSDQTDGARAEYDPWEPFNRKMYAVNQFVDHSLFRPLAKGYETVVPTFARRGVSNFFDNLLTPRSALNNFLQGQPGQGFSEFARFFVNSTIGVGGLFDIAGRGGMQRYDEDFAQTLAVWGLPAGPYVMFPITGPHTLLDAVALPVDVYSDLLVHTDQSAVRDKLYVLRVIDLRYRLLAADKFLEDSTDPYITLRESYLQNREYEIYDGDPPEDDDFYDEFLDLN